VAARRTRVAQGSVPTQAELLKLWAIKEEKVEAPAVVTRALTSPAAKPEAKKAPVKTAAKKVAAAKR
jgi:hypothetical protein